MQHLFIPQCYKIVTNMSRAKIVLTKVLEIVSFEMDVPEFKIISKCSEAEVVDARWICVKLLSQCGYYTSKIAELMRITPRYVQYMLTDFEDRIAMSRYMRNNYERVVNKFRNNHETNL